MVSKVTVNIESSPYLKDITISCSGYSNTFDLREAQEYDSFTDSIPVVPDVCNYTRRYTFSPQSLYEDVGSYQFSVSFWPPGIDPEEDSGETRASGGTGGISIDPITIEDIVLTSSGFLPLHLSDTEYDFNFQKLPSRIYAWKYNDTLIYTSKPGAEDGDSLFSNNGEIITNISSMSNCLAGGINAQNQLIIKGET